MQQPRDSKKVSLLYGLVFGLVIGIIDIVYSSIVDITKLSIPASLSQALSLQNTIEYDIVDMFIVSSPIYIVLIVFFFLAGFIAARKTKKASTGVFAALWVGVIFLVINLLFATIMLDYLLVIPQYPQSESLASIVASKESSLFTSTISYSLVAGLALILIGLVVGTIGGMIGKSLARFSWDFDIMRFPIYLVPSVLITVEWLLRILVNEDSQLFIGPTAAVAGIAIVLPLFPSRPTPVEELIKDPDTHPKFRDLQQHAIDLEAGKILSNNVLWLKERIFLGTCGVSLVIITMLWYFSIYLELTSTDADKMLHVILSILLGVVSFIWGVVLSEIRDGMHRKPEEMQ